MASKKRMTSNLELTGRVALDPELKFGKRDNKPYINIIVAYSSYASSHPNGGQPLFLKFIAFGELSGLISQMYAKGDWIKIVRARLLPTTKRCRRCPEEYILPSFVIDELDTTDLTDIPGDAREESDLYGEGDFDGEDPDGQDE